MAKNTIVFDEGYVDHLCGHNYFGQDGSEEDVARLWISEMPINKGDEIPEDEFTVMADAALVRAITRWNNGERV